MIDAYLQHVNERAAVGVPPLPLTSVQADDVMKLLQDPPAEHRDLLLELLAERIAPGVDPAAKVKADFLGAVARGEKTSPLVSPERAVELLGTMLGGYNVTHLIDLLQHESLADAAADALERTLFVFDGFDAVRDLAEGGNAAAQRVLKSWAEAEWFTRRPEVPRHVVVFKVDGETNTDDLSPAKHATTRPDIPVHALAMLRDPHAGRTGPSDCSLKAQKGHPLAYRRGRGGHRVPRESRPSTPCSGTSAPTFPMCPTSAPAV
jgi:aconitate hydratase 2/2-methylisocitrate dehydratase